MQIRKRKTAKPRTAPFKFGKESRGRRALVRAVMERGFSKRVAIKSVDVVIRMWREAILNKDSRIEMPIGCIRVRKTPKHLFRRQITATTLFGKKLLEPKTWTIYNEPYRILWRARKPGEWQELLRYLNGKDTPETSDLLHLRRTG